MRFSEGMTIAAQQRAAIFTPPPGTPAGVSARLDFKSGQYYTLGARRPLSEFPGWSFTRASSAWDIVNGQLAEFAADVPRIIPGAGLRVEAASTNYAVGSATNSDTYWPASTTQNGITSTKVGSGTEGGYPYVDIRFQGTATNTFNDQAYATAFSRTAAAVGQVWTASIQSKLIGGTAPVSGGPRIGAVEETSANAFVGAAYSPTGQGNVAEYEVLQAVRTIASANQTRIAIIFFVQNGATVDVTYRFRALQYERGSLSSYIPAATTPVTRAADNLILTNLTALDLPPAVLETGYMIAIDAEFLGASTQFPWLYALHNNGSGNELGVYQVAASGLWRSKVTVNSASQGDVGTRIDSGGVQRLATRYEPDNHGFSVNGQAVELDANGGQVTSDVSVLQIGRTAGGGQGSWMVEKVMIVPSPGADSALQTLSQAEA